MSLNGASYLYSDNGEPQKKIDAQGTTLYKYDVLGNLRSVTLPDGRLIEYVIDASNRRVGKKVNGTLVAGLDLRRPAAGEWFGVALTTAIGGAEGFEQGVSRGAGEEWSHWIPDRLKQARGGWVPDAIVDSQLNGQYVSATEHALTDP